MCNAHDILSYNDHQLGKLGIEISMVSDGCFQDLV